MSYVIVPGIGGSDSSHWQTHWESALSATRIAPGSWDQPAQSDWHAAISAVARPDSVLIAHSLGCLAVASWLIAQGFGAVAGAFLVSPPDRDAPAFPAEAAAFETPRRTLPVPCLVVASSDDPFSPAGSGRALAEAWAPGISMPDRGDTSTPRPTSAPGPSVSAP